MTEQAQPPQPEKTEEQPSLGIPNIMEQMRGGAKPSPSEIALLLAQIQAWDSERWRRWKEEQDERWRRWKDEQEEKKKREEDGTVQNSLSQQLAQIEKRIEQLEKTIAEGGFKKRETEIPDWAKNIQKEVQAIRQRLKEDEQKERDRRLIEEHQRPLLEKLKEAEARYVQLEKTLEEIKNRPTLTPQETASIDTTIKQIKGILADIREAGKALGLKEPEELTTKTSTSSYEGIPVRGEIPVWAVAIPKIIDDIFTNIEKRAQAWLTPQQQTPLIQLPPKPPTPTPQPIQPQPIRIEQPLIKLPPKPEPKPEEPKVEIIEVKPENPPEPPAQLIKKYKCKICGEEFTKPYQLAAHTKKHRKTEKQEEEEKRSEQKEPSQTKE
jgi:hypothetical protein